MRNRTLRKEILNAEWFSTTKQAQIVINQWLRQYNHVRPHKNALWISMRYPNGRDASRGAMARFPQDVD
ncbi:MAG: transposase [Hyphomicrobium sp.]|nr:transposase [Hyphomicrobium sp.]